MNRLHLKLAAAAGGLLFSNLIAAQVSPYAPKEILPPAPVATHVRITQGPQLESAYAGDNSAIITWTSNNPGGSDEHFGVVHYGTNPQELNQIAKSHIRLNQNHPTTVFRVLVPGLQSKSTYYYTVDSTQANGKSDGVKSPVKHFSTP
jgi:Purple acid Phosphatase, N-terminal domain